MLTLFKTVALRQLRIKPLRTTLTILGVALGISLWVAIRIINQSTLHDFQNSVESVAGKAQLIVSGGGTGFDESNVDKIAQVDGVKNAVPLIVSRGYFAGTSDTSYTLIVLGADLLKEQAVRTYKVSDEQIIEDPLTFLNQADSIILTKSFAADHGLKIDSKFELSTAYGKKAFTVRGLLSPEGPAKAYGGALALMDIDGARATFGKDGKVDRVDIIIKDGYTVDAVRTNLEKTLGRGFIVDSPETQSQDLNKLVSSFQIMLEFFSLLALLVGLCMVTNSVSINIAERRREIGTLRALGSSRKQILFLFVFDGFFAGLFGSALGAYIGTLLAKVLVHDVTRSLANSYLIKIDKPVLQFTMQDFLYSLAVGVLASIVAAFYPSYKATLIGPLEAIKLVNTETENKSSDHLLNRFFNLFSLGVILTLFSLVYTVFSPKDYNNKILQATNLVCSFLGITLICQRFIHRCVLIIKDLLPTKIKNAQRAITRLSVDNLLRNPRRTTSNVAILLIGLSFFILVSAVNISFRNSIMSWIEHIFHADILIASNGNITSFDAQPIHESIESEIVKIPGIKLTNDNHIYSQRFMKINYEHETIVMKAMENGDLSQLKNNVVAVDGNASEMIDELFNTKYAEELNDPNAVFPIAVSESFVNHFRKKKGDIIDLDTPHGVRHFKITGQIVDFASPKGVICINKSIYKILWNDHLVNLFAVYLLPGYSLEAVRKDIDSKIGQKLNLITVSNAELKSEMVIKIDQSFAFMHSVEIAALLVALLGILNTLFVSVMERTRELGLLRAVGMSRAQTFSLILKEALIQGLIGGFVSISLGSWIAYTWMTKSLSLVLGWIIQFYYPWGSITKTMLLGIFVTLIAGIMPSNKASKIEIKEALEYE